jgi:16S rRNA (adenine1518-N6/adenine1519-N6)-dimethyltransferase
MYHDLTNPDFLEQLLQKHGITPEHSAGQNFLVCEEPLEALITAMEGGGPCVTELGAGLGTATAALLAHGYHVRAIERDRHLAGVLGKVIPKPQQANLELQIGDLREAQWHWDEPWQLVGNIPYNLSGYIIRRLTGEAHPPTQAIFMVQREVGDRLAAAPGDMNLLGLAAQLWGSVHLLLQVPRTCFVPAPAVDSALVLLVPHTGEAARSAVTREAILKFAKLFFQQKRKQMGGVAKRNLGWPSERVADVLGRVGIPLAARPQDVSVEQWAALARHAE